MEKPSISFFVMDLVLLFALISFILIVFELHRFAFVFELAILLAFMFLLSFAMYVVYYDQKWGWSLMGFVLILLLANTLLIALLGSTFETVHLTAVFFSTIGIVIALANLIWSPDFEENGAEDASIYYPLNKVE